MDGHFQLEDNQIMVVIHVWLYHEWLFYLSAREEEEEHVVVTLEDHVGRLLRTCKVPHIFYHVEQAREIVQ